MPFLMLGITMEILIKEEKNNDKSKHSTFQLS